MDEKKFSSTFWLMKPLLTMPDMKLIVVTVSIHIFYSIST